MTLFIEVKNCARCGEDHKLPFTPFENHDTYTYWSMCPTKEQPILMRIITDE